MVAGIAERRFAQTPNLASLVRRLHGCACTNDIICTDWSQENAFI